MSARERASSTVFALLMLRLGKAGAAIDADFGSLLHLECPTKDFFNPKTLINHYRI